MVTAVSCLVLACLTPSFAGAPAAELVEQALLALEAADLDRWAFVETTAKNDRIFVQRHDPTLPEGQRWFLVSVGGRQPTDGEREEFTNREPASGEEEQGGSEIRAMISPDSLTMLEETATHLVYRFDPAPEDEEDAQFYRHVDATLRIARSGPYVESVELRSRKPFSAGFGVKIREFVTVMSFAPVGDGGDVLPSSVRVRMAGRAMLVKKIDESVDVSYSDYHLPDGP